MSLITRTDVTAVKLLKNEIITGIGSYVNIFDRKSAKLLRRIKALNGQKIYGFATSTDGERILVFGGKQFTAITLGMTGAGGDSARLFAPVVCDDWLHSVLLTEDKVTLLTAHNVVQKWDLITRTLISRHPSPDNSILYSGLLLPLLNDAVVFAGTVFSDIIVYCCRDENAYHRLKGHKGVIFSISCHPKTDKIVTTSDDRSVRIWHIDNIEHMPWNTVPYWKKSNITCAYELYGHTARVMRSHITNSFVISVGEDGGICFWDNKGTLQKRLVSHQSSPIWALDADEQNLVTGAGDCGITLHHLALPSEYSNKDTLKINGTPRKVVFTARGNISVLNDDAELVYYDVTDNVRTDNVLKYQLVHESSYILLAVSSCKQIVAVADMTGKLDVFIENCKGLACLQNVINTKLNLGNIQSMQWAGNRYLVICSDDGDVTLLAAKGNEVEVCDKYLLPHCKERWLTAAAIDPKNNIIVLGDRCGNIHLFTRKERNPVKTLKRVHGRYGPTSITVRNNEIVTTGRDGCVKYFTLNENLGESRYLSSKDLEFKWVEKFLDKNESLVCGFQERTFVVYNTKMNSKVIATNCGGGHRSWDAIRYFEKTDDKFEECIKLVYLKNSDINIDKFLLSKIICKNIVHGSHSKEINCLKAYKSDLDSTKTYYVTGGEDTTLRISEMSAEFHFEDKVISKQLSNIRALKIFPFVEDELGVISAGGRAQICINAFKFTKHDNEINITSHELVNHMIKGSDVERKKNKSWKVSTIDFDPETRIMDVDALELNGRYLIFAGCSDAYLRVFSFAKDVEFKTELEVKYHETCILKTKCIKLLDKDVVVTCTTRGKVTFWKIIDEGNLINVKPFYDVLSNKSGINSFDYKVIENRLLIATGGDDNSISLSLLEMECNCSDLSLELISNLSVEKHHCSQVTGVALLDSMIVSTSIDQRITVSSCKVEGDKISCAFLTQVYSDIADIQGLELLEFCKHYVTVCVFGKGFEVFKIRIPKDE